MITAPEYLRDREQLKAYEKENSFRFRLLDQARLPTTRLHREEIQGLWDGEQAVFAAEVWVAHHPGFAGHALMNEFSFLGYAWVPEQVHSGDDDNGTDLFIDGIEVTYSQNHFERGYVYGWDANHAWDKTLHPWFPEEVQRQPGMERYWTVDKAAQETVKLLNGLLDKRME